MDRSSKPTFSFVNLKHPDDLKDEETQLRIRRLAMTEVGKARRKPRTKRERNEVVLELRNATQRQPNIDRLGSGSIDPFSHYPIELDDNARVLLANIFNPESRHASQLRGSWFPVGLDSPAAFHHALANSQNFIFQKMYGYFPSQDNAQALIHHQKALRFARELLSDSTKHTSNKALGTIVSFICHHVSTASEDGDQGLQAQALLGSFGGGEWKQHHNALLEIIDLRGGYNTIDQEYLRITISWGDLMGSFAQDIPPSVPLPRKWEADSRSSPGSPRPHSSISLVWKQQLPMQLDWVTIFDDVVHLISLDRAFNEQQLELAVTSGSWVEPTMYRLLAIRPLLLGNDRKNVLEEVCRLGTLLFLAPCWRTLGQSPVWTAAISRNLQLVLLQFKTEWNELKPLLVWTLYFAAVETSDLAERSQFVFMLAMVVRNMQLRSWSEVLNAVKGVLWVDKVSAGSDELIRDEVMQIVNHRLVMPTLEEEPTAIFESLGETIEGA
ncbi:hypothetical protein BU25DRAFT_364230 [Macroventuria anomochaeta]|uniref:Uncharacterized protein n=1 Tax=Macroventuria anomochaeta TaxID=301207 RepID=A0ACB6S4M4_9PLEO|nr:uncharacterized protein BU25DRAFT_364230 [Macroventuria anomochaeta]KAF2629211.1 hypothetical protein BU25DRAFT_364230 [Macroventuria anomochaeta]